MQEMYLLDSSIVMRTVGERPFNFKLAAIFQLLEKSQQIREKSVCGHGSKFPGKAHGCISIS